MPKLQELDQPKLCLGAAGDLFIGAHNRKEGVLYMPLWKDFDLCWARVSFV